MGTTSFKCTGALSPDQDAHLYVERPEDHAVRERLARVGTECVLISLIGARQMGKTSLLYRLQHEYSVSNGNWIVINIDMSELSAWDGADWYLHLIVACCEQLAQQGIVITHQELQAHCETLFMPLYSARGWAEMLRFMCRQMPSGTHLMLALDEISTVPPNQWEIFFSQIRVMHETAKSPNKRPEYRLLGIILAGAFVPGHLIKGENSPFNVSTKIYMSTIQHDQLQTITRLLDQAGFRLDDGVTDLIFTWTSGVLYHIQRLCDEIVRSKNLHISSDHINVLVSTILFNDDYIQHIRRGLQKNIVVERTAYKIFFHPLKSTRNTDTIATLEIMGVIRYDDLTEQWHITNRLCVHALQDLFIVEEASMTGLEPIYLAALTKAVDFLFGESAKILQERRELRKEREEVDDTPPVAAGVQNTTKADIEKLEPKTIYLKDNHLEISHLLELIEIYRKNRRLLRRQLASYNGVDNAPVKLLNDLDGAENNIKKHAQELKTHIEHIYGHKTTIIGLE